MALDPTQNPEIQQLAMRLSQTNPQAAALISPDAGPAPSAAGVLPATPGAPTGAAPMGAADVLRAGMEQERGTLPQPRTGGGASFREKMASAAQQLGWDPKSPGSWSRALVSSAVDAMAAGDVGQIPRGGGGIYGMSVAAKNIQAQRQSQADRDALAKQLAIENERANKTQGMEQQKIDIEKRKVESEIYAANIREMHAAQAAGDLHEEHLQTIYKNAQAAAKPFKDEGAEQLGTGLTSDQLKQKLQDRQLDLAATHFFVDGFVPVLDADGKQALDKNGLPRTQATYEVLGPVPEITLDKRRADYLNKFGAPGSAFTEGTKLSGDLYYSLTKRAQQLEVVDLNRQKLQSEVVKNMSVAEKDRMEGREKSLTVSDKQQNLRAAELFSPYLSANDGDVVMGLQAMAQDPKQQKNVGLVEAYYGKGAIEKYRKDTISQEQASIRENQKVISNKQSQLEQSGKLGSKLKLSDADRTQLQSEIKDAQEQIKSSQQKINQYTGLHSSDPARFAPWVEKLKEVSPEEQTRTIVEAKTVSPMDKLYLLQRLGIPVSPDLFKTIQAQHFSAQPQAQPQAQAAPAQPNQAAPHQ